MTSHLETALTSVEWNANVADFVTDVASMEEIEKVNLRTAIWARQLEKADAGNPALSFVREMQTAGIQAAILIGLAMYKASASSMRAMLEAGLYYTYFRTHPEELATLVSDARYFIGKSEIIDYHKLHSIGFKSKQEKLGLITKLDSWYSDISAVVHGQIPGKWSLTKGVAKDVDLISESVAKLIAGEDALHRLLLCTAGTALWDSFSPAAKAKLLKGLPGDQKAALDLDVA